MTSKEVQFIEDTRQLLDTFNNKVLYLDQEMLKYSAELETNVAYVAERVKRFVRRDLENITNEFNAIVCRYDALVNKIEKLKKEKNIFEKVIGYLTSSIENRKGDTE